MGGVQTEQLNIEGKRSGEGFITGKARLIEALTRSQSERVNLVGLDIGRKGLIGYLKALSGNTVKIVPDNGNIKVACGASTTTLDPLQWIDEEKSPHTLCEVRIMPKVTVTPNMGNTELAEALDRVLPMTATGDERPVLNCVLFTAKEGKLTLVSADGFRLAVQKLDFEGEGEALVNRIDLAGIANALRKARRVNVSFKTNGRLGGKDLVLATELITYELMSIDGTFPDYAKLIPSDFKANATFSAADMLHGANPIKALNTKAFAVRLKIGEGKITVTDDLEHTTGVIDALTDGDVTIKVDGSYLISALRCCGGMVDLKLVNSQSPMLFSTDGYSLVVMPMFDQIAKEAEAKAEAPSEAKAEAPSEAVAVAEEDKAEAEAKAEAVSEAEAVIHEAEAEAESDQPKRKRNRKPHKEPVPV